VADLILVRRMSGSWHQALASFISKSEKAQRKVAVGTWQHAMLRDNVKALQIASVLMSTETDDTDRFTANQLDDALRALASMINRAEEAQAKFSPGTSHHTLQRNRLDALRLAEAQTKRALNDRRRPNKASSEPPARATV
jgi:hypothetical protein